MAKILVVDDEPEIAGLMSDWLRMRGYDVLRAADGVEALRIARVDGPDLVLLDAFMPGLDGLETGRRLRAQPETRHLPIVLIAGEDAAGAQVDRMMAGASDAVTRPVALDDLGRRMQILLEGGIAPDDRAGTLARSAVAAAAGGLGCQIAWLFGPGDDGLWISLAASAPGHPEVIPAGRDSITFPANDEHWIGRALISGIAEFNIALDDIDAQSGDPIIAGCVRLGAGYVSLIPLAGSSGLMLLAAREMLDTAAESTRRALLGITQQAEMAIEMRADFAVEEETVEIAPIAEDVPAEEAAVEESVPERPRFGALREATLAALNAPGLDVALQSIIGQTAQALGVKHVAILLLPERDGETLVVHRAAGLRARRLEDATVPVDGSLAGDALRNGKVALYGPGIEARAENKLVEERTEIAVESAAAAPLMVRGEAAGALLAINHPDGLFPQDDIDLLQSLANLASITIGGVRFGGGDPESESGALRVLHRAAEASAAQPVPALLDSITRLVMDGLGVKACEIRGWDARHSELITLARRINYRRRGVQPRSFTLAEWPAARQAIDTGAVVRVSGNRQETRGGAGMHSLMLYPLPGGMLAVMGHPAESLVFGEEHVGGCRAAAESWAASLPAGTDKAAAAGALADMLLDEVEAPWCAIYALDSAGTSLVRVAEIGHISYGLTSTDAVPVDQGSIRRAALFERKTLAFAQNDDRLSETDRGMPAPFDAGVTLITPIHFYGETIGLIEARDDNPARSFGEHDRLVLQAIASMTGAAIGRENTAPARRQPIRPDTEQAAPLVPVMTAETLVVQESLVEIYTPPVVSAPEPHPPEPPAPDAPPLVSEVDGLRRTMASLENVARIALDAMRPAAEQAGVTIMPFFGEFLPDIFIDRERILLVFKTLLGNAIKYSPHGGRVTLTIHQVGQMIQAEVADHGIGIPLDEQRKIWEVGEAAASAEGVHGLALVNQVIKAHSGRTWLISQPNIGSTFAFSLPTSEISGMGDFIPSF